MSGVSKGMKRAEKWMDFSLLFVLFILFVSLSGTAGAQTPAQPVDPQQARPALPITPLPTEAATNAAPVPATTAGLPPALSVIADSSLRNVLQELAQTWADSQDVSPQVPLTLTNANTMRTKIESGAPFDVVISADLDDVKELTTRGLIDADGQHSVSRNTVVLYGRAALVKDDQLEWFDLIGSEWKKVARGNPLLSASGKVVEHALQKHNLADDDHKGLFVDEGTEALALQVAEREQADAVFLYRTDLQGITLPGFEIFPISSDDAPPVFYTAAVSRLAKDPALARSFIEYCGSEAAREIWKKYGFESD